MTKGVGIAFALWVGLCVAARADAEPVLHERVFGLGNGGMRCRGGVCVSTDAVGADGKVEVRAVEQDGRLVPAPTGGATPNKGEQVFRPEPERAADPAPGGPPLPGDPPPERRPLVRMDRDTGTDAAIAHGYHAVFTPSEFPYKRISSLDFATDDETLGVFDPSRQPVRALGIEARRADHDAFWGTAVIDFEPGKWIPLPSVSADSRLLHYRTEPPTRPETIEFARDGADNFFVRAVSGGGAGGQRRLTWLTDVPQTYFAGPIPPSRLEDEPRALLRPLPPKLRRVALGVLDAIGIRAVGSAPLRSVLDPLVTHFRAFEMGKMPPASESTYRDLALSQRGVCRHRAFAFLITALAAGIPTRYVENELHVFVEVYLPKSGWRRINLGGAALDDSLAEKDDRPAHRPRGEDPLPHPSQFAKNATPPQPKPPRASEGDGNGSGVGPARGNGSRVDLETVLDEDAKVAAKQPKRKRTSINLTASARVAYRGDTIEINGNVSDGDGAVADLPIELYLEGALGAERVADVRSGADGSFSVVALLPAGLALGSYGLVARTPGDGGHQPSSSRSK